MALFGIDLAISNATDHLLSSRQSGDDNSAQSGMIEALEALIRIKRVSSSDAHISCLVKMKYNAASKKANEAIELFGESSTTAKAVSKFATFAIAMDAIGIPVDSTYEQILANYA